MSIWKSPVFYFGVALFLAVAAALLAPFVVDWNVYKPQLEAYGQRLSGRQVKIDGNIEIRLFPIPRLEADDVRLFNEDSGDTVLAASDKIVVEVTLGGLLNGSLDVQAISFDAPVVNFIRRANGELNFLLAPDEDLQKSSLLKNVKLERITVKNGTLVIRDETRSFERAINNFDAVMSAQAVQGPWRLEGSGIQGGRAIGFNLSTGVYDAAQPFRFGLKVSPRDSALPQFFVEASLDKGKMTGGVKAEAVPREGAKASKENTFSNLTMTAKLDADFNRVKLKDVKIIPRDVKDGTTLVEGEITAEFGENVRVNSNLEAPRINLSGVTSTDGASGIDVAYLMATIDGFMKGVPENWQITTQTKITNLTLKDGALEDIEFVAETDQNALRIRRFAGRTPGRSRFLFDGLAFPATAATTDLAGTLAFESSDLRAFSQWWKPDAAPSLAKYWTGGRGRIKGEAELKWSQGRVELEKLRYELDGIQGTAEIAYQAVGEGSSALSVAMPVLDLDSYLVSASDPKARLNWIDVFREFSGEGRKSERQLTLNAGRLTLNGVAMQAVDIDLVTGPSGLIIKRFDVNSIAGASMKAEGQVMTSANGPQGGVEVSVSAQDLAGFIRFAGLPEPPPAALAALGPTKLRAFVDIQPGEIGTTASLIVEGDAARMSLRGTGKAILPPLEQTARIEGDLILNSEDGAQFLQWFGWNGEASAAPGKFALKFNGDTDKGLKTDATLSLFGTEIAMTGLTSVSPDTKPEFAGDVTVETADASQLARGLGVPWQQAVPLKLKLNKARDESDQHQVKFSGTLGAEPVEGLVTLNKAGEMKADVALPPSKMADIFAPLLFAWNGSPPTLASRFAEIGSAQSTLEFWLRPKALELAPGWIVKEAAIGFKRESNRVNLVLRAKTNDHRPVKFEFSSSPGKDGLAHKFTWELPVPLGLLFASNGETVVSGDVHASGIAEGRGDNLQTLLGNLGGNGAFGISTVKLGKIDVTGFVTGISTATAQEQVSTALSKLEEGAGSEVPETTGPLTLENGVINLIGLPAQFADAQAKLSLSADLSLQTVEARLAINLAKPTGAPVVEVNQSGGFGDVTRVVKSGALASLLGYDLLSRDMAELEKVQQEQERIAREEAEQVERDNAKFEAYQEQKAEIRLRQRELRVFASERTRRAKVLQEQLGAVFAEAAALRRPELARRNRELQVFRTTANGKASPRVRSRVVVPDAPVDTPIDLQDLIGNDP